MSVERKGLLEKGMHFSVKIDKASILAGAGLAVIGASIGAPLILGGFAGLVTTDLVRFKVKNKKK